MGLPDNELVDRYIKHPKRGYFLGIRTTKKDNTIALHYRRIWTQTKAIWCSEFPMDEAASKGQDILYITPYNEFYDLLTPVPSSNEGISSRLYALDNPKRPKLFSDCSVLLPKKTKYYNDLVAIATADQLSRQF